MINRVWFERFENPIVGISNIVELKAYLLKKCPTYHGLKVNEYLFKNNAVHARVVFPDGYKEKRFFGYLDSITNNIQNGLYETK